VGFVVADDADGRQPMSHTRRLLAYHDIATPLATAAGEVPLAALDKGDVAYLCPGWLLGLPDSGCRLVRAAIERGHPVVPIPGPALPITALVASGLPADSFLYLGELPRQDPAWCDLLASVAGERRTLVVVEQSGRLVPALADLQAILGDRPVVIVAAGEVLRSASETESAPEWSGGVIWRGSLGQAPEAYSGPPEGHSHVQDRPSPLILIVGGARGQELGPSGAQARWDEARLRAEIGACLERGLGAREIGRLLASESGWPRREIYRLAVEESSVAGRADA
jgi:16S rRNA (cytidine1402-2'-O)-methyltransferase